MQKIILFGGTFDPIHQGHINIALAAKDQLQADKVIFVLSRAPRWKTPSVSTQDRLEMLKLAIKDIDGFSYSTYEIEKNTDFDYSIDTARHFVNEAKEKGEDIQYYWLIGSDQVAQLDRWASVDELTSIVQFVYYSREIDKSVEENVKRYHLLHINGESFNISSTAFRKIDSANVPDQVFDYMVENGLYFLKRIKELLDERRLVHSISVARLARQICQNTPYDENKAFYAGLFHDIGKNISKDEAKKIIDKYYYEYAELPRWAWHQFVGVYIARNEFNIEDEEILEAISYHATGKGNMSPLGRMIYAADKIEPTRGYDSSDMIDSCLEDYQKGFVEVLKANKEYLESKDKSIHNRLTDECFDCYLKK